MSRFVQGARVRVRSDFPPGHIRTPVYLRGKSGLVLRDFGDFPNAEVEAHGRHGPHKAVYKVRFAASDLWDGYQGAPNDAVEADLYEHWLEMETNA